MMRAQDDDPTEMYASDSGRDDNLQLDDSQGNDVALPSSGKPSLVSPAPANEKSLARYWRETVLQLNRPVIAALQVLTSSAARHPRRTVVAVTAVSVALLAIGVLTNFTLETGEEQLWTPQDSLARQHGRWMENESGFADNPRQLNIFVHANGADLLHDSYDAVDRAFVAVDAVRDLPQYDSICGNKCRIYGVVRFFNYSDDIFRNSTNGDNNVTTTAISSRQYSDGTPVADSIFGHIKRDDKGILTYCQAFSLVMELPDTSEAEKFEKDAIDALLDLNDQYVDVRVELVAERSFSDEFERAIIGDIPLIPVVFVVMSLFTCAVFMKRDKVHSRSLLGFGAVVAVVFSIMSGYGLMFLCGVPFTSMTQILPFIVFGVGLDDAFILFGAYERTNLSLSPEERIAATIDDIGLSITLTTLTSTLAFGLGCLSSVPAVFWLCLYAFPTLIFDYLYQLTFFVALVVLDEKRIQQGRRDCCVCVTATTAGEMESSRPVPPSGRGEACASTTDRNDPLVWSEKAMIWYAEQLLRPSVKVAVVVLFGALAGMCGWSASQLTQEFEFTDVVPSDSYITSFFDAYNAYSPQPAIEADVVFRFVDQSDPDIQALMVGYVDDLVAMDAMQVKPDYFWLRDFQSYVKDNSNLTEATFTQQLDEFLANPVYADLYAEDIVREPTNGSITVSRVQLGFGNVDQEDVRSQIDALVEQADVTEAQSINLDVDGSDYKFFTYDDIYNIWTFYKVSVSELILTTVLSIASVALVSLLWIPHWTAVLFTLPLICVLYVDMLGVMQWAGLHVNAVTYVTLVMSIGLLVDFIVHVLLRYYEVLPGRDRRAKTIAMLQTMGASVMVGGISTFLGTLPLAFSRSEIFNSIFISFLALVTLGMAHGLVLLPVLLSLIGPQGCFP